MTDEQRAREWRNRIAGEFHLSGQCGSDGGTFDEVLKSGYECCCYEAADLMLPLLASRALEEAKWWYRSVADRGIEEEIAISQDGHYSFVIGCKRIAALEQAASKAGGERT